MRKYQLPEFLEGIHTQTFYESWLRKRAQAHIIRDRKRGNQAVVGAAYRVAIHEAIVASQGKCAYTGEILNWALIGRYKNAESKLGKRKYKAQFAAMPTVDHVDDGMGNPRFQICAWQINDAKSDLTHEEFVGLCRKVLNHALTLGMK